MRLPYFAFTDSVPRATLRGGNDVLNAVLIVLMGGEAIVTTIGGPGRWLGEQYAVAREFPAWPYSWAAFLAFSIVMFAAGVSIPSSPNGDVKLGRRGVLVVLGAALCATWCFAYAYSRFRSGQLAPSQVGLDGMWTWSCIGMLFILKIAQHMDQRWLVLGEEET